MNNPIHDAFEGDNSSLKRTFDEAIDTNSGDSISSKEEANQNAVAGDRIEEVVEEFQKISWCADHELCGETECTQLYWLRTTLQSQQDRILKVAEDYMNESDYENFVKDLGV